VKDRDKVKERDEVEDRDETHQLLRWDQKTAKTAMKGQGNTPTAMKKP
jgi:hypothetical protein